MSREDIERDAAAQLGMAVDAPDQSPEVAEPPAEAEEPSEPVVAAAGRDERGPGRVKGWLRDLVDTEPAAARRERLEREAAAEIGVQQQPEQPVG